MIRINTDPAAVSDFDASKAWDDFAAYYQNLFPSA
jgi:hypothetical protein